MTDRPTCELCGHPMPAGEEMFNYHGYSGPSPSPALMKPKPKPDPITALLKEYPPAHKVGCPKAPNVIWTSRKGCTCGLDALLTSLRGATTPAFQCHECGNDGAGEPFRGTVDSNDPLLKRTYFFCSWKCRFTWGSKPLTKGEAAPPVEKD